MMDGNVKAFLDAIAACEGTGDAYNALFGYRPGNSRIFDNGYSTHPRVSFKFTQTDGRENVTTAAGRYQEIYPTFARLSKKLGTTDFSPATQDAHAIELIAEAGAMPAVKRGDFQTAIDRCAGIWASLPASQYPQPVKSIEFALNAYRSAGGMLA
jgi:muramidase (phage lysozyme)